MKRTAFSASIIAGCFLVSCSSSKKATEQQPSIAQFKGTSTKEIKVDGNDADWQGLPSSFSPTNNFTYSVTHDEKAMYVLVKITNPVEQTKFLRGGMEVWIDPNNKSSKSTEVIFPVKGELDEAALHPQNSSSDAKVNRQMMHLSIKAQLISMNRIGFKPEYSGVQSISQNTGFKAAINWTDENELVYELSIPFQAFQTNFSKNNFQLEFSMGALERQNNTAANEGERSGGWNREGGGMNRGGMRGGGSRSGGYGGYGRGQRTGESNQGQNTDWKKIGEKENFWVQCNF